MTVTAVETFALVVGVAMADSNGHSGQNRVVTKVLCNEEGGGNGGKSDGNKGGGQATEMVTKWAMAMATRLAGNKGKVQGRQGQLQRQRGQMVMATAAEAVSVVAVCYPYF